MCFTVFDPHPRQVQELFVQIYSIADRESHEGNAHNVQDIPSYSHSVSYVGCIFCPNIWQEDSRSTLVNRLLVWFRLTTSKVCPIHLRVSSTVRSNLVVLIANLLCLILPFESHTASMTNNSSKGIAFRYFWRRTLSFSFLWRFHVGSFQFWGSSSKRSWRERMDVKLQKSWRNLHWRRRQILYFQL